MTEHDPLEPPCGEKDAPTPGEAVARLTRPQREQRVAYLTKQAHRIADDAVARWLNITITRAREEQHRPRQLVATCVLFSGGNDSTTLAHLFRGRATHALHANTGIGIEQTRQFVRETCADWGLPLLERRSPYPEDDYERMVAERGFPGPGQHWKMYQRLKEHALDEIRRRDLGLARSRTRAALWLAGRRRAESARRSQLGAAGTQVPLAEYDGAVIWASPLAHWTKLDLNTYRLMHPDVPRNEVSDLLHMSGECLCGAFAKPAELELIAEHFPGTAERIRALEGAARAAGHPEYLCRWGHGLAGRYLRAYKAGRLCGDCSPANGGEVVIAR